MAVRFGHEGQVGLNEVSVLARAAPVVVAIAVLTPWWLLPVLRDALRRPLANAGFKVGIGAGKVITALCRAELAANRWSA
jgi:hypothetical protein